MVDFGAFERGFTFCFMDEVEGENDGRHDQGSVDANVADTAENE